MKKQDEKYIQNQCWIWFMTNYGQPSHKPQLLMHSVINGFGVTIPNTIPKVYHDKIRQLIAMAIDMQKSIGLVPGVSDTLIHGVKNRCIWVEFKEEKGKQREAQIRQQKRTEANGGIYLMPKSIEQFKTEILKLIPYLTDETI